ncbi:cyclic lactone autoinducer peptide [Alkaliphilus oremlandii]|nr:cyclic lactone autoinducer peptide [Alkaliphilus oremlandii]
MKKRNILLSLLALVAVNSATLGAGVYCLGFLYQPECPERLKKN